MSKLVEVKPQPKESSWTREQWQAITTKGKNVLVAAAAGSGKTAVLVTRLIERILDEEDPLDVDRLLVVTFTNAAAGEMRKRIGEALENALKKAPHSRHIRKQLNLLPKASISTIHSFCLEVVRRYYYQLDLDPQFRIADDTEALLLREEVLEELFEDEYGASEAEAFYALVDRFSSDRSDTELQELVLRLYDFSRSHPQPESWLEQLVASYQVAESTALVSHLPWTRDLIREIGSKLKACLHLVEQGEILCRKPGGPLPYLETLEADRKMMETLLKTSSQERDTPWERLYELFLQHDFGRLKSVKKGEADPDLQQKVKDLRDQYKKIWTQIKESYFLRAPEEYLQDLREMAPHVKRLVELVHKFAQRYEQEKRSRLLVDFADLEHYCLRILAKPLVTEDGVGLEPTAAALAYRERFAEVLVDEYQDTNLVQEAIIQLISRDGEEGNRFMVGDVKQSIYRFRLAEPSLFLEKYKSYLPLSDLLGEAEYSSLEEQERKPRAAGHGLATSHQNVTGLRIDLAKNFRSRQEVLAATNFIFKQVMDEQVGDLVYGPREELVFGASYYPPADNCQAELILIDRAKEAKEQVEEKANVEGESLEKGLGAEEEGLALEELETVQLEARLLAEEIKRLVGERGEGAFLVYDKEEKRMRPVTYRDIVILLRSTSSWAPVMLEELKAQGIPVYAELESGYFEAVEVAVMLSLLQVIDNPLQDIPLVAVLRSPIVGLKGEELAQIRLCQQQGSFFEALKTFLEQGETGKLQGEQLELWAKLAGFYERLKAWRTRARQGALSSLIWQIYRETGYYDFVGSMAGGKQRQANLQALYDRARQYEQTSFRGLFRFLRFIEKMRERGGDLGSARALGEQEDVVRLMTIHKSKGLEFPVVFLAGLGKQFNLKDLSKTFLLHKELGLGTKYVDPEQRISFATLPQLAIQRRLSLEHLAEEMRILYVALTRAREKLYLVGTVNQLEKRVEGWLSQIVEDSWLLPDYERSKAVSYLDWLGPALLRHRAGEKLYQYIGLEAQAPASETAQEIYHYPAEWRVRILKADGFQLAGHQEKEGQEELLASLRELKPLAPQSQWTEEIDRRLSWRYPYQQAERFRAKQTVTELKRLKEARDESADDQWLKQIRVFRAPLVDRPRFLQAKGLTAAELGTAMHVVMQHIDFSASLTLERIREQLDRLVERELITPEQREALKAEQFYPFFQSELGQRMLKAKRLYREIPFSLAVPAQEVYSQWQREEDQELVLVQGVIDVVFEEADRLILVDYKSDKIRELLDQGEETARRILTERYRVQIKLYAQALEQIWKRKVAESYVYFFDGDYSLAIS